MTQPVVVAPNDRDDYVSAMSHIGRRHAFATAWLVDCLADGACVPVCQFEDKPEVVVLAELFERECVGYGVARRLQLPLRLAWALSVHKAQGMGLSKVRFDPARTFDDGQAYVALSRCTNMAGLSLVSECRAKHLRCDRRAVEVVEHIDALKRRQFRGPAGLRGPVGATASAVRSRAGRRRRRGARGDAAAAAVLQCDLRTSPATPSSSRANRSISGATRGRISIETRTRLRPRRRSVSKKTTLLVECSETNALGRPTQRRPKVAGRAREGRPRVSETGLARVSDLRCESGVGAVRRGAGKCCFVTRSRTGPRPRRGATRPLRRRRRITGVLHLPRAARWRQRRVAAGSDARRRGNRRPASSSSSLARGSRRRPPAPGTKRVPCANRALVRRGAINRARRREDAQVATAY